MRTIVNLPGSLRNGRKLKRILDQRHTAMLEPPAHPIPVLTAGGNGSAR